MQFDNKQIKIAKIPSKGRALVATTAIKKGDLLVTVDASPPLPASKNNNASIVVLLDDKLLTGTHCGVCLGDSSWGATDLKCCINCNQLYICKNCNYYHNKRECKAYQAFYEENDTEEHAFMADDTTLMRQLIRLLSQENYAAILENISILEHHYEKESEENKYKIKQISKYVMNLMLPNIISSVESSALLWQQLIETSARFSANEILISQPWRWRKTSIFNLGTEDVGIGVFINASFANHSCKPNAHYTFEKGPTFMLIALEDIEKNEEISISYTSLYQSTQNRQMELEATYHFKCNCLRCVPSLKDKIEHKHYFDKSIDEMPINDGRSDTSTMNSYSKIIDGQQRALSLVGDNKFGSARQILQSLNIKKLKRALSSDNNIILHATRMMQIGLAHIQNDHMYVNSWVEKVKGYLNNASMYNEYSTWILWLNVIKLFHGTNNHAGSNGKLTYLNEIGLLYGAKLQDYISQELLSKSKENLAKRKRNNNNNNNNMTGKKQKKRKMS